MSRTSHSKPLVLVTGCGGYIAGHVLYQLNELGKYSVRGTVRSLSNQAQVQTIRRIMPDIELVEADLLNPDAWEKVMVGVKYVLHTATAAPVTSDEPRDDEIIKPMVEGTLNVLKACQKSPTVSRVILTSSVAAISSGYDMRDPYFKHRVFTETDWGQECEGFGYSTGKLLAERAAWQFMTQEADQLKFSLTTICPGFVLGPFITDSLGRSGLLIKKMLEGDMLTVPETGFDIVDVRDVARAHILAMENENAAGQRYVCVAENIWWSDLAILLKDRFGHQGYKVPTTALPNWVIYLGSLYDRSYEAMMRLVGSSVRHGNDKIKAQLGMTFTPRVESVVPMVVSMADRGMIKRTKWYNGCGPSFHNAAECEVCGSGFFYPLERRHHCRGCGRSLCAKHAQHYTPLPQLSIPGLVRVCDACYFAANPDSKVIVPPVIVTATPLPTAAPVKEQLPESQHMPENQESNAVEDEKPDLSDPANVANPDHPFHLGNQCEECGSKFRYPIQRRHHCRGCGRSLCGAHSSRSTVLPNSPITEPVRACDTCFFVIHPDEKEKEENRKKEQQAAEDAARSSTSSSSSDDSNKN